MKNKKLFNLISKIAAQGNIADLKNQTTQYKHLMNDELLNQAICYAINNSKWEIVEYLVNQFSSSFLNVFNPTFDNRTPLMLAIAIYNHPASEKTLERQQIIDLLIEHSDCNVARKKDINAHYSYRNTGSYSQEVVLSDAFTVAVTYLDFDSIQKIYQKNYTKEKYYKFPYIDSSFGSGVHFILDFIDRPNIRNRLNLNENFDLVKNIITSSITEDNAFYQENYAENEGAPCIFSIIFNHVLNVTQKQEILLEIFKNLPSLLEKPFSADEIQYYSKKAYDNSNDKIEGDVLKECQELAINLYSLIEKQILEHQMCETTSKQSNKFKI